MLNFKIHDIKWSDHAPIFITVEGDFVTTRANRWRNDVHLMSNPENREKIRNYIWDFFALNERSVSDPFTLWNSHKAYMRGILLQMSCGKKV